MRTWVWVSLPNSRGTGGDCTKLRLFQTDACKLPWRIEEARKALIFRCRELLRTSPNCDAETEAIEDAF